MELEMCFKLFKLFQRRAISIMLIPLRIWNEGVIFSWWYVADVYNGEEYEGEEEQKSEYLCPFCSEDFDVVGLCCHIDEEHAIEAKNGVQTLQLSLSYSVLGVCLSLIELHFGVESMWSCLYLACLWHVELVRLCYIYVKGVKLYNPTVGIWWIAAIITSISEFISLAIIEIY